MTKILIAFTVLFVQSGFSAPANVTSIETPRNSSSTSPTTTITTEMAPFAPTTPTVHPNASSLSHASTQTPHLPSTNTTLAPRTNITVTPPRDSTSTTTSSPRLTATNSTRSTANQTFDTKLTPANSTLTPSDRGLETTVDHPKNTHAGSPFHNITNNANKGQINGTHQAKNLSNEIRIVNEKARIAFKKGSVMFFSGMCGPTGCISGQTADEVLVPVVEVFRNRY